MQTKKIYNHLLLKNVWFNTLIRSLWRYFMLYILVIIVSHLVFYRFGLLYTNVDSARYLLSALIQSEAAIVAIVVTLSLVAAQFAASSYSTRVIEVFISYEKNPELFVLLLIYGSAMFWGLGVLKLIEVDNSYLNNQSNLEGYIVFSYCLGIFAFIALVPYIRNTLELLKPSTLFNLLAERITKQNILESIGDKQEKTDDKDPVQPIVDIIRGALMKYDYETIRSGLRIIGDSANSIFQDKELDKKDEEKISKHFFDHLTRFGRLAVSKDDEESTREVIATLHKSGMTAVEYSLEYAGQQAAAALGKIGKAAVKQNLNDVALTTIHLLTKIERNAAQQELYEVMEETSRSFSHIGEAAIEQKFKMAIFHIINSLSGIGIELAKQKQDETTADVVESLRQVGVATAHQELKGLTWKAAFSLNSIGIETIKQNLSNATWQVAYSLGRIGKATSEQKFDDTTREVVGQLEGIANVAAEKRWKGTTEVAINSIGEIGIVLSRQKKKDAVEYTIKILEKIEETEIIQKLEIPNLQIKELINEIDNAWPAAASHL